MKMFFVLLVVTISFIVTNTSCTKSQFSTTVARTKNGKTIHENVYHRERIRYAKKNHLKNNDVYSFSDNRRNNKDFDRIQPKTDVLIASTSKDLIYIYQVQNVVTLPTRIVSENIEPKRNGIKVMDTIRAVRLDSGYNTYYDSRVTEKLGLSGFILTLVGWVFVFGFPLSIIGVVFGSISLGKIKRNPRHFKGRGFAIASLILGIIGIVASIVILSVM